MIMKRELGSTNSSSTPSEGVEEACEAGSSDSGPRGVADRRVLRSRYLAVKSRIGDESDDMIRVDSDKFQSIIDEVESLHNLVQKPREQVADAEALLDIANRLVSSVKTHNSEGITPSDFVTCLLRDFGQQSELGGRTEDSRNTIFWKDIGVAVSHVFRRCPGCCTMIGPMNTELKQRKSFVRRKHVRPTESARPEEFDDAVAQERTDTDKNMSTMFDILRKNRSVRLENLVLNRNSFAQTVENLFALTFLVKDGRAEIKVNEKGCHFVSPRNAPSASAVAKGDAAFSHFVFRLDFKDWKLMTCSVGVGEELMPHRNQANISSNSEVDPPSGESQAPVSTTPIWKLCRNRGLVLQEQSVVEDSPQGSHVEERTAAIRKKRRTLKWSDAEFSVAET